MSRSNKTDGNQNNCFHITMNKICFFQLCSLLEFATCYQDSKIARFCKLRIRFVTIQFGYKYCTNEKLNLTVTEARHVSKAKFVELQIKLLLPQDT